MSDITFESLDVLKTKHRSVCLGIEKNKHKILCLKQDIEQVESSIQERINELSKLEIRIDHCTQLFNKAFTYMLKMYYDNDITKMLSNIDITNQHHIVNTYCSDLAYDGLKIFLQHVITTADMTFEQLLLIYNLSTTCTSLYHCAIRLTHPPVTNDELLPKSIIYLLNVDIVKGNLQLSYIDAIESEDKRMTRQGHKSCAMAMRECKRWAKILYLYYHEPEQNIMDLIMSRTNTCMVKGVIQQHISYIAKHKHIEAIIGDTFIKPDNTEIYERYKQISDHSEHNRYQGQGQHVPAYGGPIVPYNQ